MLYWISRACIFRCWACFLFYILIISGGGGCVRTQCTHPYLRACSVIPVTKLAVSCFSKIQIGFTFLVPARLNSPGQRAVKRACVCVCSSYGFPVTVTITVSIFFRYTVNVFQLLLLLTGITLLLARNTVYVAFRFRWGSVFTAVCVFVCQQDNSKSFRYGLIWWSCGHLVFRRKVWTSREGLIKVVKAQVSSRFTLRTFKMLLKHVDFSCAMFGKAWY